MLRVTLIIAIRLPDLTGLVNDLFSNSVLPWMLGAMMFVCGLVIIAFHQYWYSLPAIVISYSAGSCAARADVDGLPPTIETGAGATRQPGLQLGARVFFLLLTAIGVWLTYVGWVHGGPRRLWITSAPHRGDLPA